MGTVINLYVDDAKSDQILDEIVKRLKIYEERFSANDPSSELMKINHNAGVKKVCVHPDLYNLIEVGKKQSLIEDSLLNIAIGPLVQKWRIGFEDAILPSESNIRRLLEIINPHKITLDKSDCSVYLEQKSMLIDLGALAKGYIADLIINYLKIIKVTSAMINLGGNIVVLGDQVKHLDGKWRIGIRNPIQLKNENIAVVRAKNQSIVTSGVYERSLNSGGKTYHHILDSRTGYPVETDVLSLTIVSNSSLDGEIWTTRLFGKSSKEILRTVNNLDGIECLVILKNEVLLKSNALET